MFIFSCFHFFNCSQFQNVKLQNNTTKLKISNFQIKHEMTISKSLNNKKTNIHRKKQQHNTHNTTTQKQNIHTQICCFLFNQLFKISKFHNFNNSNFQNFNISNFQNFIFFSKFHLFKDIHNIIVSNTLIFNKPDVHCLFSFKFSN